jgi:hypothetical protein
MPEGPPPGMSKDEEEVDTDDDIPMPDGPPPGSTSKSHSFDARCALMTRLGSIHFIATPHPPTAATSWFPSRYRYTSSASRFPQRAFPPSASRFPRTTTPTPARLPWRRAAPRRIYSRTSGAIQQPPTSTAGLLPTARGHADCSNFGIPPLRRPRHTSTSTCGACTIDGNSIRRGAIARFQEGEHRIRACFTPTSACCTRRRRLWERRR